MAIRNVSPPRQFRGSEIQPGTRLRNARERLGLTYPDVERVSYGISLPARASRFHVHLSRLADIENRDVTPSLYKLYALAVIFHLDPKEVCQWYGVPFEGHFSDGLQLPAPNTHLGGGPASLRVPIRFDPAFDPSRTNSWTRMVERWGDLEGTLFNRPSRHLYGYVGLDDRRWNHCSDRKPGSGRPKPAEKFKNSGWNNEYERPIYFIEVREGFRCCLVPLPGWKNSCSFPIHCRPAHRRSIATLRKPKLSARWSGLL